MPFRRIFEKVWIIDEQIHKDMKGAMNQDVSAVHYQLHIHDHSWPHIYSPIAQAVNDLARQVAVYKQVISELIWVIPLPHC